MAGSPKNFKNHLAELCTVMNALLVYGVIDLSLCHC